MAIIADRRQVWMDLPETLPSGTRYAPAPLPALPPLPNPPPHPGSDAFMNAPKPHQDAMWAAYSAEWEAEGMALIEGLAAAARASKEVEEEPPAPSWNAKERDELMAKVAATYARARLFQKRIDDPKLHRLTQRIEFSRAARHRDELVDQIVRDFPGPWSEDEQVLMCPL